MDTSALGLLFTVENTAASCVLADKGSAVDGTVSVQECCHSAGRKVELGSILQASQQELTPEQPLWTLQKLATRRIETTAG